MGALHCVTDNHMHSYTAQRTEEIIDTRHPLRLRTSTRGFDATVELQQAMSRFEQALSSLGVCGGGRVATGERREVKARPQWRDGGCA